MNCEKQIVRYRKLPSESGVHFHGFEHVPFDSRRKVENQIRAFLGSIKETSNPQVRVILGDWGEGKTELFERFLKTKEEEMNHRVLYCVASNISNAMKTRDYERMVRNEVRASVRFFTALMIACYKNERNRGIFETRHKPMDGRIAEDYVDHLLQYLTRRTSTLRVLFFIDEFEELLGQDSLPDILSGMKEVVNQEFRLISSGESSRGDLAGQVHLMLACTPDAYHRIPRDPKAGQIFGGWERRTSEIRLKPIRKKECVNFLGLLNDYSFEGEELELDPFLTTGFFETIHRISLGNIGNIVKLYAELLSRATLNDKLPPDRMCVIYPEDLLEWLGDMTVSAYGGTEYCLSNQKLEEIMKQIKKNDSMKTKAKELFFRLITDGRAISYDSIANEMPALKSKSDFNSSLEYINQCVIAAGMPGGIVKVRKLKDSVSFEDLLQTMSNIFEKAVRSRREEGYIIGDDFFHYRSLRHMITFRNAENNNWHLFFPSGGREMTKFFGVIPSNQESSAESSICKKLLDDEPFFILSPSLADQIFPTPIPPGLGFVVDRVQRLNLWRKVNSNFNERFEWMAHYITDLYHDFGRYKIRRTKSFAIGKGKNGRIIDVVEDDLKMRIMVAAASPEATKEDIEFIHSQTLGGDRSVHFAIIFVTGRLSDDAHKRARELELFEDSLGIERLVVASLHPSTAKQMIAINSIEDEHSIDDGSRRGTSKSLLANDIQIDKIIDDWIRKHEKVGVIIDAPVSEAQSPAKLEEGLRFFSNFPEQELKPEDALKKSFENYQRFTLYGGRTVFTPDITENTLKSLATDLHSNGFLEKAGLRYKVKLSNTERFILEVLQNDGALHIDEIKKLTVSRYRLGNVLKNLILNALEYKGLVKEDSGRYSLTDWSEIEKKVRESYQRFNQEPDNRADLDIWGGVFISKQRDKKLITYEGFSKAVEKSHSEFVSLKDDAEVEVLKTKGHLLNLLIDYYFERISPLIADATRIGTTISSDIRDDITKSMNRIKEILRSAKPFAGEIDVESLREIDELDALKKELDEIMGTDLLKLRVKKSSLFDFNSSEAESWRFNPRVYYLSSSQDKIRNYADAVDRKLEGIREKLSEVESDQGSVLQITRSYELAADLNISRSVQKIILTLVNKPPEKFSKKSKINSLNELKNRVQSQIYSYKTYLSSLRALADALETIIGRERKLREEMNVLEGLEKAAKKILGDEWDETTETYHLAKEYSDISNNVIETKSEEKPSDLQLEVIEQMQSLYNKVLSKQNEIRKCWSKQRTKLANEIQALMKTYAIAASNYPEIQRILDKLISIKHILEENLLEQQPGNNLEFVQNLIGKTRDSLENSLQESVGKDESDLFRLISESISSIPGYVIPLDSAIAKAESSLDMDRAKVIEYISTLKGVGLLEEYIGYIPETQHETEKK